MNVTSNPATSIEDLDREVSGLKLLRFSPEAERRYEAATGADRTRLLINASMVGLVLYDLFLLSDWQMVGDVFHQAVILRLGIYTPAALMAILVLRTFKLSSRIRESIGAVFGVLCSIPILLLFTISETPTRVTYHYGTLIVLMFVTLVQRVEFRYAVLSVFGILIAQFVAITHSTVFSAPMVQSEVTFYVSSAFLSLFAAYALEREQRRSYLLVARGRLLNEQLDHAAKIDPLTGLWNRRHLNAAMQDAWMDAESSHRDMTVILLDVDHFKMFNDNYGHMQGDRCLERLGACLRSALVTIDNIAVRFGGEEFLVFLPGANAAEGRRAADILRQAIQLEAIPFPWLGPEKIVTVSIGLATCDAPHVSPAALTAAADAALYEAKAAGRDCISPHVGEIRERAAA